MALKLKGQGEISPKSSQFEGSPSSHIRIKLLYVSDYSIFFNNWVIHKHGDTPSKERIDAADKRRQKVSK